MTDNRSPPPLERRLQERRRQAARDLETEAAGFTDIEAWTPTSDVLEGVRLPLAAAMDRQALELDAWSLASGQEGTHVEDVRIENVQGPSFIAAGPHTDLAFKRYFILFVLAGEAPKAIQGWGGRQVTSAFGEDGRLKRPAKEVALVPGQMVIFDAHQVHGARLVDAQDRALLRRLHRLAEHHDGQADTLETRALAKGIGAEQVTRLVTRCLCIETHTRPTTAHAEALMQAHVLENAPELCAALGLRAPTPSARRKAAGP